MGTFLQKKNNCKGEFLKCVGPKKQTKYLTKVCEVCTNQQEFLSARMSFKVGFINTFDFIAINYKDSKFVT